MKYPLLGGLLAFVMLIGLGLQPAPILAAENSLPGAAPPPHSADSEASENHRTVREDRTDRLIVKFKDPALARAETVGSGPTKALSARAGVSLSHLRAMSGDSQVFKLPERLSHGRVKDIAEKLSLDPDVEYAVPDRIMHPTMLPNDPSYGSQYDFNSFDIEITGLNVPSAWDITTGASNLVVAVIDTGILNHVDLQGRLVPGYNFISDGTIAGNGIGRTADPSDLGDWYTPPGGLTTQSSWHGSHVTGTIAATSNNGVGVTGINWNSRILPVRALGHGGGYWSDIADGMRWAAGLSVPGVPANANPAKIINMSLGTAVACNVDMQRTVDDVTAAGAVVVAAAGNASADAANFSPASCSGVVSVAAVARTGRKSGYSNYGRTVKIAAPGDYIWSTVNSSATLPLASPVGDIYATKSGTSMATPHVAGVASLMLSLNPALTPAQVLAALQSSARAFPAGSDCTTSKCGAGMVDAYQAVRALVTNVPIIGATPSPIAFLKMQGEQNTSSRPLSIDLLNGGTLSWSASSDAPWLRVTPAAGQGSGTATVTVDTTGLVQGNYEGSITITVNGAMNSPVKIPVTLHYKGVLRLNVPTPTAVSGAALAAVGGKLYLIGGGPYGGPALSQVQIYDTVTNTWSAGAAKPTAVMNTNAAVIDGKIYVPGGNKDFFTFYKTLEVYDPASNQWFSRSPLPVARYLSGVEAVNAKLYVIGGSDGSLTSKTLYRYDPASDTWSALAEMGASGRNFVGTGVVGGKIYAFGGYDGATGTSSNAAQVYDPGTNSWSSLMNMPEARTYLAGATLAGQLYAIGGTVDQTDRKDAIVYDPVENTWSEAPFLLNQARSYLKAATAGNDIYVIGGTYSSPTGQFIVSGVNENYTLPPPPVDGVCGSANGAVVSAPPTTNLCATGAASTVTGSGVWNWTCAGTYGGITASCTAYDIAFPVISTVSPLPNALRGHGYATTLSATGGVPPYTWSVASGAVPAGMSLDPTTGVLAGTPSLYQGTGFTAQVTDAAGGTDTRALSLLVKMPQAMIARNPAEYHDYIYDAYRYCSDGDTIRITANVEYNENLPLTRDITVSLRGGYEDQFATSNGGSILKGKLSVSSGNVKLYGIRMR